MRIIKIICIFCLVGPTANSYAESGIQGYWLSTNDSSGEPSAIVKIIEKNNVLLGFVEKVLVKGQENALCEKCEGSNKNIKIQGMQFLGGMTHKEDHWVDGWVIDSENGKTYSANAKLVDGGSKLKLDGYVGIPLFGRTKYFQKIAYQPELEK
jgi:uncharacterized protein (DUF2147 family)